MKLLTKNTFRTSTNNWYAPAKEFAEKYKSVEHIEYVDTTSSAGDWSGFFIQRIGKYKWVSIAFSQENNYPGDGFTLKTSDYEFVHIDEIDMDESAITKIRELFVERYLR